MNWINSIVPPSGKVLERLPILFNFVLIVILAHNFAKLTWDFVPVKPVQETIPQNKTTDKNLSASGLVRETINTTSVSQWHLFGKYTPPKPPVVVTPVQEQLVLPETQLNLTLTGIISSSKDRVAKAIIADSTGIENFYTIGDLVPGNAILKAILDDQVNLEFNGRLEVLRLPKDTDNKESGRRVAAAHKPPTSRPNSRISSDNKETGTLLREYREALVTDPQSLMDLVRAQPVRENGKLVGYKIRPGRDRKLLRKFGLRSGDVVTGVNGVSLDNPIKGLEIMRDLSTASQVTVDIKRRGVSQTMSFQVD